MCCDDSKRTHLNHEWESCVEKVECVLSSSMLSYLCCLSMNQWFVFHFHQNTMKEVLFEVSEPKTINTFQTTISRPFRAIPFSAALLASPIGLAVCSWWNVYKMARTFEPTSHVKFCEWWIDLEWISNCLASNISNLIPCLFMMNCL